MADYLTLTEFVPGTKAKAQEVNENFATLKDAINTKASVDGDSTKTFSVAEATEVSHAVNKQQLSNLAEDLEEQIHSFTSRFCVKSGNITGGKGDLFSFSGLVITAKVGGNYPNLVVSNGNGEFMTFTSFSTIDMTGKADGTYNIFLNKTGSLYVLANNIYKQASRPTLVEGDVWFNTSIEPSGAIKYTSATDEEFLDIPLGIIVVASSAIASVETFAFNQNGYDINFNSEWNLKNFWQSGEYTPVVGTVTTVSHNLGLKEPQKAIKEVLLKCITAEAGYSVGDTVSFNGFGGGDNFGVVSVILAENTIQVPTTSSGLVVQHKTGAGYPALNIANWRYVFRIWY